MKLKNKEVLEEIISQNQAAQAILADLKHKSNEALCKRTSEKAWNALECAEHLNMYSRFYLPEINQRLSKLKFTSDINATYNSSWLGNKFAVMVAPLYKGKPMKTLRKTNTLNRAVTNTTLTELEKHLNDTMDLLGKLQDADLGSFKVPTSISKFIRVKLGDALRVLVGHNLRHMQQAEKAIQQ